MKWILISIILLSGCKLYDAPNGGYFPYHWGEPPTIQLKDYVELPAGFGHGSSTLKHWIELNIQKDTLDKQLNGVKLKLNDLKLSQ